jgi:hypothetical protein
MYWLSSTMADALRYAHRWRLSSSHLSCRARIGSRLVEDAPVPLRLQTWSTLSSNKLKVYNVHEDLLTKRTEYFKTCLQSNFKEGHARFVSIYPVCPFIRPGTLSPLPFFIFFISLSSSANSTCNVTPSHATPIVCILACTYPSTSSLAP